MLKMLDSHPVDPAPVDTITPLKLAGVIEQNVFIPSWLGKIVLKGQRKDFWDKPSAIPEWRVQELLKEHGLEPQRVARVVIGDHRLREREPFVPALCHALCPCDLDNGRAHVRASYFARCLPKKANTLLQPSIACSGR